MPRTKYLAMFLVLGGCGGGDARTSAAASPLATTVGDELLSADDAERAGELSITFFDVGQGDCILVECPNGNELLVDCGSVGGGDRDATAQWLEQSIDGELEMLVVTHPDADHITYLAPTRTGPWRLEVLNHVGVPLEEGTELWPVFDSPELLVPL